MNLEPDDILAWLRQDDPGQLEELWRQADLVRRQTVGDQVHLRGLVEISSHCARQCAYCGLRAGNRQLPRYRMSGEEILACAREAVSLGLGTLVLQAGEDAAVTRPWMAELVQTIKSTTPLAVTLSLGERSEDELAMWKQAGADRYLLRFETSDAALFARIHPPRPGGGEACDRIAMLRMLRRLGYEVGSGVMVGIPGQTIQSLADDLALFRELDLDMIGIGPFIPHPQTPLGAAGTDEMAADQAPASELMVYKMVALARLVCPQANIPATTALATINRKDGRELGLRRGANVVMPNLTPLKYRSMYQIYPAKACTTETGRQCDGCLRGRIAAIGRTVGSGPGSRRRQRQNQGAGSSRSQRRFYV